MRFFFLLLLMGILGPTGATQPEMLFGMSTTLSGPAAELGTNMRDGVLIAFDRANRNGGVDGKALQLHVLDDAYEPARAARNVHDLASNPDMLAIVGNVGTPTAIASLPVIREHRILFFAPFTGAGVLRRAPPERYIVNYRASYAEETAAMVNALIDTGGLKPHEIAFFTQRDGYGDAGFYGGITALRKHGLKSDLDVAHVRYERNTLAVESALADLLYADPLPRAIIIVGAYAPAAKFIGLAREHGINALMLNVSFVGSRPLADTMKAPDGKTLITQVVPHPAHRDLPIVAEYLDDLARYKDTLKPSFGSLEGYLAGRVLIRALNQLGQPPTREALIDALEGLGQFDPGLGYPLNLSKTNHQASHEVWPTKLNGRAIVPFDWAQIGSLLKKGQSTRE
ncbi:ABC transporter substrate-binding protein [Zoogloeaceae bacterium G21618-S1]|nr:ABC transporter substrate-binding protein [Zoogloeaceae bacterium G21618-S1]